MNNTYIAIGMFFIFSGLVLVALGALTAYFGARRSRIVGIGLLIIGLIFLFIPFLWKNIDSGDLIYSFLEVIAVIIGLGIAIGLFIAMIISSEPKPDIQIPEVSGEEDKQKEEKKKEKPIDEEAVKDTKKEEKKENPADEEAVKDTEKEEKKEIKDADTVKEGAEEKEE